MRARMPRWPDMNPANIAYTARKVLDAIKYAEEVGCIDHLDCWDGSSDNWYKPIEELETAIKESLIKKPWGSYQDLFRSKTCVAKSMIIDPGERTSLQRHRFRGEFWVVEEGTAHVVLHEGADRVEKDLQVGGVILIPASTIHQICNITDKRLRLLELQWGLPEESDIERLEDPYAR